MNRPPTFRQRRAYFLEALEQRQLLDASGFVGNPCPPDLEIGSPNFQAILAPSETVTFNLFDEVFNTTVTDEDAEGNPSGDTIRLQLDPDDGPEGASLTADGEFRWQPTAEQVGTFEFVVIAIDSGNPPLADAEVLTIEVAGDTPPDLTGIEDVTAAVNEELIVNVSAIDQDADTISFNIDPDTSPAGITIEQEAHTSPTTAVAELRFTPTPEMAGQSLEVSVLATSARNDGPTVSDSETFTINVMSVAAVDDQYDAVADAVLSIDVDAGVLANDFDVDDDPLTVTEITAPSNGQLVLQDDGSFEYTPDTGFTGTDTFVYEAQDAGGDHSSATVTIEVTGQVANQQPEAVPDSYATSEGLTLEIAADAGVLLNDSDPDGDDLSAVLISPTENGDITLNADGSFTYVPDAAFSGADNFRYAVSDGEFESQSVAVGILVVEVNSAPTAIADEYDTPANTTLTIDSQAGVLANDSDAEDDNLTVSIVDQPADGTVDLQEDGSFTYTPDDSFIGEDSFTYQASDESESSEITTVTITVTDPNSFQVSESAVAGSSVGTITTTEEFTSPVVYQFVDDGLADELVLNADDHMEGDPTSRVVVHEYYDFQCPACAAWHPFISELEDTFSDDLLVVRRHLPLESIHPHAREAAQHAEAAGRQGEFIAMGDLLFENQSDWTNLADPTPIFEGYAQSLGLDIDQLRIDVADPDIDAGITEDAVDASFLGANSTPTFYLQGERVSPNDQFEFEQLIQDEIDSYDDPFLIDRQTGEILIADPNLLDSSTPMTVQVLVRDDEGNTETVDVVVNVESTAGGVA